MRLREMVEHLERWVNAFARDFCRSDAWKYSLLARGYAARIFPRIVAIKIVYLSTLSMMACTISRGRAFGECFGFEERVGISCQPPIGSLRHHFMTVDGWTPYRLATFRIDQPRYFTNRTASLRTFPRCGFVVYAISIHATPQGVAKVLRLCEVLTQQINYAMIGSENLNRKELENGKGSRSRFG